MQKVFVINKGYHDYSDARRFGQIEFMSEGSLNKYCVGTILRQFKPFIDQSEGEDFILISSMSIASVLACSLFSVKHKRLNLLIFNAPQQKYYARRVRFEELEELEEELEELEIA